ncbi:MAG: putative major facilitator superfamily transporter [Rhodopila sp.]|jgi:MFS transporter, DHA1 family, tetracycline resistance protein|nr:putative major facilitator superfamily transporter [Rhodopila sp.]
MSDRPNTGSDRPKSGHAASVRFILVTLVIDALGFGLVVPIVPSLVLKLSGMTISAASMWVGLLLTAFALMQFVCAPVLGGLSDRFGRRPVLLLSLSGICANYLLLAWAPSLTWLFLGRLIAGATAANAATATAYIADVTPPQKRAGQFGLVGAMFGIGFIAGPAFGGVLGAYGLRLPFFVAAGLAGCNVLYGLFVLPESLPPSRRRAFNWRHANPVGSLRVVMANPDLARLAIAWGCIWFALGALQSTFVLANQARFGWDTRENGLVLAVAGLGSAVVQGLLVRRIVPALGERRAAMVGGCIVACAYLCIGLAPYGWMVVLGIVMQSVGAITSPAIQGLVSASADADHQGEMQGALSSVQGLTAIVSPLVASWVFSAFTGPAAPVFLPGAPFLVSTLAYGLAIWAIFGVRPPPALVSPEAEVTVAAGSETGGN